MKKVGFYLLIAVVAVAAVAGYSRINNATGNKLPSLV